MRACPGDPGAVAGRASHPGHSAERPLGPTRAPAVSSAAMSRIDSRYRIGRHTAHCEATGAELAPGTETVTVLVDGEDDGLERRDFDAGAWAALADADRPADAIAQWRTVVPDPDAPKQAFVDDETLVELFRNLESDPRPARRAFRFVLGLLLVRKKLLKLEGRARRPLAAEEAEALREAAGPDAPVPETIEVWLVRAKGDDPEHPPEELVDPGLSEADVEGLSDQIAMVLDEDGGR